MPFALPSALSSVRIAPGESFLPSRLTASPLSKPMRTSATLSGAAIGEMVR